MKAYDISFLEKYVKRDEKEAKKYLESSLEKIELSSIEELGKIFNEADSNNEDALEQLALFYFDLSQNDDCDYELCFQLYLESLFYAFKLYNLNKERGSLLVGELCTNGLAVLNYDGEEDYQVESVNREIGYECLLEAWEEYGYLDAGVGMASYFLSKHSDIYNPEKGLKILKDMEELDDLPALYYSTLGREYLRGGHLPQDISKAEELYQKAYDLGDESALMRFKNLSRIGFEKVRNIKPLNIADEADQSQQKGCYVATCVYGSYDCPEVWVLRRFRDYKLSTNIFGKAFIKVYYFISPKIVRVLGNSKCFKMFWKNILDKMVKKYKKEGFDDTPYLDI